MEELELTVISILVFNLLVMNLANIVTPLLANWLRQRDELNGADPERVANISSLEEEVSLQEFDRVMGLHDHYSALTIQFGYVALFSTSCPMIPLLVILSNAVEIRVDAWELMQESRRPEPSGAEDIGTWQLIFEFVGLTGMATNLSLIALVDPQFEAMALSQRVMLLIAMEHTFFCIKYCFMILLPDVPRSTSMQVSIVLSRQQWYAQCVY